MLLAPPAQFWERLLLNGGGSFVLFSRKNVLLLFVVVVAVIRGLPASRSPLLCCAARKFEVVLRAVSGIVVCEEIVGVLSGFVFIVYYCRCSIMR